MIWHDLVVMGIPLGEKVLRTVAVYAVLALLLRLAGKRDMAQLNNFDLVVMLLLSNVVQNAVIGSDNSVLGGVVGAAVLVAVNFGVVRLVRRSDAAVRVFEGTPTTLVAEGRLCERAIQAEGIRDADVVAALLHQGATDIRDVRRATLAPGGTITVQLYDPKQPATKEDVARVEAKLAALLDRLAAG